MTDLLVLPSMQPLMLLVSGAIVDAKVVRRLLRAAQQFLALLQSDWFDPLVEGHIHGLVVVVHHVLLLVLEVNGELLHCLRVHPPLASSDLLHRAHTLERRHGWPLKTDPAQSLDPAEVRQH